MKKKLLVLFVFILLPIVASADAVEIDGIYYNLITKGNVAEVASSPNEYIGNIVIPQSVTYKGVSYSVTSIGDAAFKGCEKLYHISLPNSVKVIGNQAFNNCRRLEQIDMPAEIETIKANAFSNCALTTITIPESVISIGQYAFEGCNQLNAVNIYSLEKWLNIDFGANGGNPLEYAHHLYLDNIEITYLNIPEGTIAIKPYAFWGGENLTGVTLPLGLEVIGYGAFAGCKSLSEVVIPNTVNSIDDMAFRNCSRLAKINVPIGVTSLRGVFVGCENLTQIELPISLTSLERTFYGCSALKEVEIPNGVKNIGLSTYYGCNHMKKLIIGKNVASIDALAFANCNDLGEVYIKAEKVPSTNSSAFQNSYIEYATLYVPASSFDVYKQADPWKNFKSIMAIDAETLEIQKCSKPSISYKEGKLTFNCETEGATCQSSITDPDITSYSSNEVQLGVTYNISVYATKTGFENSETSTATLCWIDVEPKTEGITNGISNVPANAVLIQSANGILNVSGVNNGANVSVYTLSGQMVGASKAIDNQTSIITDLQKGEIVIVKIGEKSVKVIMQ